MRTTKTIVRGLLSLAGVAVLAVGCGGSPPPPPPPPRAPASTVAAAATPVLATVVAAPVPVLATDGRIHLAYELELVNAMGFDVTVTSVTVKSDDQTLLTLPGDKLGYWMRALGAMQTPTTKLGPGQAGIVWLDVSVDGGTSAPKRLTHTIDVSLSTPSPPLLPATMTEDVAHVDVSGRQPVSIDPPLRGQKWLDGNSCCDMTAHRMAMNPLNGGLWAAERFAIDYVRLGDDDTMLHGDKTKLDSYPYFGADIHAVADGPVVAVVDGLPEQTPGQSPTGLPLDQYGGNHVVQDIGGGNYAFYAHLQTGSISVKTGDRLSSGQVFAKLGNTGNTDAPHLHFHVMDTPDPLRSNGLPFTIKDYRWDAAMTSMAALDPLLDGKPAPLKGSPRPEFHTSPLVLDVMSYGNG